MDQEYASIGSRFVASLVDGLIIGVPIGFVGGFVTSTLGEDIAPLLNFLLQMGGSVGYFVWYQAKTGQTIGKKMMHIRVVNAMDGQTPSMGTLALREIVGKFVSSAILMIGYLWAFRDPRKQALHDKIANTLVIKAPGGQVVNKPAAAPPAATQPTAPAAPKPPAQG